MDVAFLGLGVMGMPMAANLVRAGHRVTAVARRTEIADKARERGIEIAGSVSEAVRDAHVVITMLPDGPAVTEVALGPDGILSAISADAVYVDMSTIAPAEWHAVHERFAARRIAAIDAPVSGGEQGAVDGVLSIMAGGDAAVVDGLAELFAPLGNVVVVGGPGSGQVVKAANQLVVAGNIQLVAEALVLLESRGVDLALGLEVIGRGLAGSTVIERKRASLLAREYRPGFRLALHAKDLGIVADTGSSDRLALPLTAAVTQIVNSAVATGRGGLDHSALYDVALEANGMGR